MFAVNRRHRLLYIALAGMEVGWSLPLVVLWLARWQQAHGTEGAALVTLTGGQALAGMLTLYAAAWLIMLLYMAAGDWVNRSSLQSPGRELAILALVLGTTVLCIGAYSIPGAGLTDWRWLAETLVALGDFTHGLHPGVVIFLYNLFLWWRVAVMTGRELGFFAVGVGFRLGMLLAMAGNGLVLALSDITSGVALLLFWLFIAFGLTAGALARIDDQALTADNSTGALLRWPRFGQLLLAVVVTVGASAGVSMAYSPDGFARLFGWLRPLTRLLGMVATGLLFALLWALMPLLMWIDRMLERLRSQMPPPTPNAPFEPLANQPVEIYTFSDLVADHAIVRYCLVVGVVIVALALIWLFFVRTVAALRRDEEEVVELDLAQPDWPDAAPGWRRLRNLVGLLRRYGVSRRLLDAISVQNIYANVSRLAKRRGFGRPLSMSPDDYLPLLELAFPEQQERLARLTQAYMAVHYGDEAADPAELAQLRQDYALLAELPKPQGDKR